MRYILLDRVTELRIGELARGIKCVSMTDDALADHFPDYPVLPGVLVVEAAAQLAGFLLEVSTQQGVSPPHRAVLVQIQSAKFHKPALPGDTLELFAELGTTLESAAQVTVGADIRGERCMRGALTFMLRAIDAPRVHEHRRSLYRQWTQGLGIGVPLP